MTRRPRRTRPNLELDRQTTSNSRALRLSYTYSDHLDGPLKRAQPVIRIGTIREYNIRVTRQV